MLKAADLESFIYELKPFALLAMGIYALSADDPNLVLIASGFVLLFCSGVILRVRFQRRKGSGLETFFYEIQPFLYLILAAWVLLFRRSSKYGVGFAALLLFCAVLILNWRFKNRLR